MVKTGLQTNERVVCFDVFTCDDKQIFHYMLFAFSVYFFYDIVGGVSTLPSRDFFGRVDRRML